MSSVEWKQEIMKGSSTSKHEEHEVGIRVSRQ